MGLALQGFNYGAAGMGAIDWNALFNQGFQFGGQFLQQWGNRGAYQHGINPNAPPPNYVTQPGATYPPGVVPTVPTQSLGVGLDGQGIRLSDGSHIGWLPIGGALLAWKLLQAQPYKRDRR